MSNFDWQKTKKDLTDLSNMYLFLTEKDRNQIEVFIDVGEYNLALDNISYFYMKDNIVIAPEIFEIIERLAATLGTLDDPEYSAVARLLATRPPEP